MKRKEIIDNKTTSLETNFEKVKRLKQTDDTRERLEASVALYEYVLPVYKTEYQQLAKLYDEGAAREEIESLAASIETKYRTGFETLFDRLAAGGKPDAARHNIKVNWDVSTAPAFEPRSSWNTPDLEKNAAAHAPHGRIRMALSSWARRIWARALLCGWRQTLSQSPPDCPGWQSWPGWRLRYRCR